MKKLFYSTILIVFSFIQVYSQIPEKFNYQGVLRNSSGELVKNTSITVKISLLQGSTSGTVVYSENHTTTTNNYGQFTVQVGGGTVLSGIFNTIDWSQQMYQKTEVANPAGGTLVDMGTTQLISVPYSIYSGKAKVLDNNLLYFTDSDTLFAVKDREGNIVFAVFPDGAKVYTTHRFKR
jgi:trimeric autotransporter adhesin